MNEEGMLKKFNIFQVAEIWKSEEIHTRVIAELINPKSIFHDKGASFLDKFLREIGVGLSTEELMGAEVETEVHTDQDRRIDMVISTRSRYLPFEVKIWAGDQDSQLQDYYEFAKTKAKDGREVPCIYYLTPDGRKPSEYSRRTLSENLIHLLSFKEVATDDAHKENILHWLKECMKEPDIPPDILWLMGQLRDNIEGQPGKGAFSKWTWGVLDVICMELSRKYNLPQDRWTEWRDGNDPIRTLTLHKKNFGEESLEFALRIVKQEEGLVGLRLICGLTQENGIPNYSSDIPYDDRQYDELLESTFQDGGRTLGLKTVPIKKSWNRLPEDPCYEKLDAEACYSKIEEIFEQLQPGPRQALEKN